METKQLLIPARIAVKPLVQMRSEIHTWFDKHHLGPEIVRVHFVQNKCIVQIDKQIPEYSSLGRLQFNLVEEVTEYDMVPRNRREIAEA